MGLYSSSIDGIYGRKTEQGFMNFQNIHDAKFQSAEELFQVVLSKVNVPTSFATPAQKKNTYAVTGQKPKTATIAKKENQTNAANETLLKLGIVGVACALTSNPGACLDGATKTFSPGSSSTTTYGRSSSSNDNDCSSDFSCGMGRKCVKKPGQSFGICMAEVNRYGTKTYSSPSSSSIGIRSYNSSDCTFNTDCPTGFRCDRKYKACVK